MNTAMIKEKLHEYIDQADEKHLKAIYTLIEEEINVDEQRRTLIYTERAKYLNGEGSSFSPSDVKTMALDKSKRPIV